MADDRERLREAFERLCETSFPPSSAPCDALDEIHADLAEYDGHVAGIASSVLGGAPVDRQLMTPNYDLEGRLEIAAEDQDAQCLALVRQYL